SYRSSPYFSFYEPPPPQALHSFPTRRSSDLSAWTPPPSTSPFCPKTSGSCWARAAISSAPTSSSTGAMPRTRVSTIFSRRFHRRSEEHTSELQSPYDLVCRLLLEKKKKK